MIGENHKFIAKTYQTQDSNSRQRGIQQTSTSTRCSTAGPIGLSLATISESAEQLLSALLRELVVNFKYAEEEHYQDHSKTPPYDLNVVSNSGKVAINMIFKNPIFADPSSNRSRVLMVAAKNDFTKSVLRMTTFIHEFFDDHIFKPSVKTIPSTGKAIFWFYFDEHD